MIKTLPRNFHLHPMVARALKLDLPVVALESTVITHGLPYPQNVELANNMENDIRTIGATPATVALLKGVIHVGLSPEDMDQLVAPDSAPRKISRRDFGIALANKENGGTTVAGTMIVAHKAGIKVFATGGIGGVHRDAPYDVSADLIELSNTPVIVVCAGAKSILDLPATVEYLETMGIPIIGYQTDEFPAFYSQSSGLPVSATATTPADVVKIAQSHWNLGLNSAILVVAPPPAEYAVPRQEIEDIIQKALEDAKKDNIHGPATTPYLLKRVSELSGGSSLKANLALLRNNAEIGAQIACQYNPDKRVKTI
jgi:pseudouridylate synthase